MFPLIFLPLVLSLLLLASIILFILFFSLCEESVDGFDLFLLRISSSHTIQPINTNETYLLELHRLVGYLKSKIVVFSLYISQYLRVLMN